MGKIYCIMCCRSDLLFHLKFAIFRPIIEITAQGKAGAFYAAQTLFSLSEGQSEKYSFTLPTGIIRVSD